jgi:aldose 1-epimerase
LIPTGEIASVVGTPLDFLETTPLGARIDQLRPAMSGYDHNFVLGEPTRRPRLVARLRDPGSGRTMEVLTTEPGMQLYTGNHVQHRGVCLETQHYPDSPNQPSFPSCVVRPDRSFQSRTVFRFLVR